MTTHRITAEIITRPGNLGDVSYPALQINVEGLEIPYVLTLALPALTARELMKGWVDPMKLYEALSDAINCKHPPYVERPDEPVSA